MRYFDGKEYKHIKNDYDLKLIHAANVLKIQVCLSKDQSDLNYYTSSNEDARELMRQLAENGVHSTTNCEESDTQYIAHIQTYEEMFQRRVKEA